MGAVVTRETLEREFANRQVRYEGGLRLFRPDDAIALIHRAAAARIPVLGVDGVFVTPGQTTSPLEHIADFSDAVLAGDGCWSDAEAFIRARRDLGLLFEVVLGERRDTAV